MDGFTRWIVPKKTAKYFQKLKKIYLQSLTPFKKRLKNFIEVVVDNLT